MKIFNIRRSPEWEQVMGIMAEAVEFSEAARTGVNSGSILGGELTYRVTMERERREAAFTGQKRWVAVKRLFVEGVGHVVADNRGGNGWPITDVETARRFTECLMRRVLEARSAKAVAA